jgi:hypothetical protein
LRNYSGSQDVTSAFDKLLTTLSAEEFFNEENVKELWKNNRFKHMIRKSIEDRRILAKIFRMSCKDRVPTFIPQDIAKKLYELREEQTILKFNEIITNFDEFCEILRIMNKSKHIPDKFRSILLNSIEQNKDFYHKLDQLEILSLFKFENNIFPEAIGCNTINEAVQKIEKFKNDATYRRKYVDVDNFNLKFKRVSSLSQTGNFPLILKFIDLHEKFKNFYGDSLKIISGSELNHLSSIEEKPNLSDNTLDRNVAKVLPYIIQKIKMWGCNVLTADNISGFICNETYSDNSIEAESSSAIKYKFSFIKPTSSPIVTKSLAKTLKPYLSRIDIIVGIINSIDSIVAQDLLAIMSKFPMSLPLIVPELDKENSFKVFEAS